MGDCLTCGNVYDHPNHIGSPSDTGRGNWMQTFTGRQFWPLDPDPAAIDIVDIAHSLALTCRYAGHVKRFYSVAEHLVLMAMHVSLPAQKWALLHDASEAYLVDVPRPVKPALTNYRVIEARVMSAVCERFGLIGDMPAEVKDADDRILVDERAALMAPCEADWNLRGPALGVHIEGWAPVEAEQAFLALFQSLFEGQT